MVHSGLRRSDSSMHVTVQVTGTAKASDQLSSWVKVRFAWSYRTRTAGELTSLTRRAVSAAVWVIVPK